MKYTLIISSLLMLIAAPVFAAESTSNPVMQKLQQELNAKSESLSNNSTQVATPPAQSTTATTNLPQNNATASTALLPDKNLKDTAFAETENKAFPLSPKQIIDLHQKYNESQQAASSSPSIPPTPVATSLSVNLAPGSTPPVIRLQSGFVTSVVFMDSTGASWPISSYDVGDPKNFNIQWDKKGNTLLIQAGGIYASGNMAVQLKGLNTPVMLTLMSGQQSVDYRVDLHMRVAGPNATSVPTGNSLPSGANTVLLNVLDGIPPDGSKSTNIEGIDGQAWKLGNDIYVRTSATILSPAWKGTMSSADGMHAYELQATPRILASKDGKVINVKVEGL